VRRVVITGLGMVSPIACDVAGSWQGIVAGKSGIAPIEGLDLAAHSTRFGGQVKNFPVETYLPEAKEARKLDPFIQYGFAAGMQAIADANLQVTDENRERFGVVMGSGIGGLSNIEATCHTLFDKGPRRISPFFVPCSIINMISGFLSIRLGIEGPNYAITTACSSGTHSIGMAARAIAYGEADIMIAGGAEQAICALGIGGFSAARSLSTRNDDPTRASRPWDQDRDGFVIGDGAGILVLEEYEHARARGARIYAELLGFGASSDAHHMTAPSENGEGPARCLTAALNDAGLNPEDVDYLNAHGTSTPPGDLAETLALKRALGDHAYKVMVSSTKSMTGHLLGAAGGAEAIFSVLALHHGIIPPTINLDTPGEGCDLDYVPHTAREKAIKVAVSNGFGFGGTNGTLVFGTL